MRLSDFDFDLPDELIATRPASPRSSARMLLADGEAIADRHVFDLPQILRPGDHLVLNDTKVIPARLFGTRRRPTDMGVAEARIEATLMEPTPEGHWRALIKPLRKLREGEVIRFSDDLCATLVAREDGAGVLDFNLTGDDFDGALALAGAMPLPPYIAGKRPADDRDREDYQTVWARRSGAVAAPTASLHFDEPLLAALRDRGIGMTHVTLHVGAGTFLPVKVDDVSQHKMHAEWGQITSEAAARINAARATGGRIFPVGTTAVRLIESAASADGRLAAWEGPTDIFIRPGHDFRITDGLMTNFHLPKSTLMMLVSALMGVETIRTIYDHAIAGKYRFFSYGDSSLLIPRRQKRQV